MASQVLTWCFKKIGYTKYNFFIFCMFNYYFVAVEMDLKKLKKQSERIFEFRVKGSKRESECAC